VAQLGIPDPYADGERWTEMADSEPTTTIRDTRNLPGRWLAARRVARPAARTG